MTGTNTAPKLEDIRFPSFKTFGDALIACGAKRDGRNIYLFESGLRVKVYKRGAQSYALCNLSVYAGIWEGSAVEKLLEDYRTGNFRVIHAD